jgi:hypothetical protein
MPFSYFTQKKKQRYFFALLTSLDTEIELCNPLEPPNFMNDANFDLIFFYFFYGTLIYFILLEYLLMLALYVKKSKMFDHFTVH